MSFPEEASESVLPFFPEEDFESAISSFEAGLALDNKNLEQALMLNEITAYEYSGDFGVAQTMMQTYLDKYPDDQEAIRENIFLSTR